jgi:hypothetical protein
MHHLRKCFYLFYNGIYSYAIFCFGSNAALSGPRRGVRFECLVLHSRSAGTLHSPLSAAFPPERRGGGNDEFSGFSAGTTGWNPRHSGPLQEIRLSPIHAVLCAYAQSSAIYYKQKHCVSAQRLWLEYPRVQKAYTDINNPRRNHR